MDTPNLTCETLKPLDLDFVPSVLGPNAPTAKNLYFSGIRMGFSIESVDLSFKHTRDRSVYGTIYLNDTHSSKVHTLYCRPSSRNAETMSSPSGGPLSLCGPTYFLDAYAPTALYVDLYEVGKDDPFFRERVPLTFSRTGPTETIISVGEEATLTIVMTAISPSTLAKFSLELSSLRSTSNEWLVSGSVTAIQTIDGGKVERRVCLFNRPDGDPMRTEATIKLDRDVLLAPLLFDKEYVQKMDKLNDCPAAGIDPCNDRGNGVGNYLSCQVDLWLVDETGTPFLVQGMCHYQFKCSHASGARFKATLKPITGEDEVEVKVTLEPFLDIFHMHGEPNESEMHLYPSTDTDADTETDSEDYTDNEYQYDDFSVYKNHC